MRQIFTTIAIAGMVWPGGYVMAGSEAAVARDIEAASAVFFSQGHPSSRATAQKALTDLVRSASRISTEAGLPAPAQERLAVAVASYTGGGFLEPETVATVHRAYEAVTGGRDFVFPPDVGSIEEARAYGEDQIERALAALDAGRSREAVREVLGFVLLVTTPMERPE